VSALNEQLTIRQVSARPLDLALSRPVETAGGTLRSAPLVLVDLTTDEGVVGRSYLRTYTPVALGPLAQLVENVGTLIEGEPASPHAIDAKLRRHFRLLGVAGLTGAALAGIDMALWDARARAAGVPLVTLLGGKPRPIPAYASLRTMDPAAAAAEAEEWLARGFTALKLKVGPAGDLDAIRAVRAAAGDGVRLMVDYNQSLGVEEALDRLPALDELGLHWIEEPTRADDYAGHARIAAAAETPIQLGENWWGPHDMEKSLAAQASDHVMLDAQKIGGVTGWLRAAQLTGLPASSHTFPEISAHLLAVTPSAHYLEYLDHVGPILTEPVQVRDGHALIPERPGSGLEWDEAAVARFLSVEASTAAGRSRRGP
jgi:mandelate racemase